MGVWVLLAGMCQTVSIDVGCVPLLRQRQINRLYASALKGDANRVLMRIQQLDCSKERKTIAKAVDKPTVLGNVRGNLQSYVLTYAADRVPYYNRIFGDKKLPGSFGRSAPNLSGFPLLTKREVRTSFHDLLSL